MVNKDEKPFKVNCSNGGQYAIYCGAYYVPVFGSDGTTLRDIVIRFDSNTHKFNYCQNGYSYQIPDYPRDSQEAITILAGTDGFQTEEIGVYTKTNR